MPLNILSLTPKQGERLTLGRLTVLVGPNNCGKSQTLRDIREYVTTGSSARMVAIDALELQMLDRASALLNLTRRQHQNPLHEQIYGVASDLQKRHETTPTYEWMRKTFDDASEDPPVTDELLRSFGPFWLAHLDAEGRFRLAAATDSYDTRNESPSNALQAFFSGGRAAVEELRSAFREAFGVDIALDWAGMKRMGLVIGPDFGSIPDTREGVDALLRGATPLGEQGDGYRSFAGVVLATLTFSDRVLLLDEPEAFLHPAQARVLGRWIARACRNRGAQVVIASHSADFLHGIVTANSEATVVRLNRTITGSTFHHVPAATTAGLIRSPLLSSQPVMDALFHRGVVVCEGDPDRAVYQTIAHTVLAGESGEDILFIHSNGKDAAKGPIELLRSAGAPVCAVLDIDVLNSANVFTDAITALTGSAPSESLLSARAKVAASVEELSEATRLELIRAAVREWLTRELSDLRLARKSLERAASEGSKWEQVKKQGVDYFTGEARQEIERLLLELRELGLFLVPCGELECWIATGVSKGSKWNRAALEALDQGRCPDNLKDFIRRVVAHLVVGRSSHAAGATRSDGSSSLAPVG